MENPEVTIKFDLLSTTDLYSGRMHLEDDGGYYTGRKVNTWVPFENLTVARLREEVANIAKYREDEQVVVTEVEITVRVPAVITEVEITGQVSV